MKSELNDFIQLALAEYAARRMFELPKDFTFDLTASRDSARGDFACNAAFKLSKIMREKPMMIAEELRKLLNELRPSDHGSMIDRVEIAGGGFINFYLTSNTFGQLIRQVIDQGDRYGTSNYGEGKRVLIEFVSANPTGPLTIAHGRQAAIGDALASILIATGHCVEREYYLNDAGRQMNLLGLSLWARYSTLLDKERPLPEEGYQGEYLIAIARKLAELKKDSLLALTDQEASQICMRFAAEEIMAGIKEDLSSIAVTMDHYFSERTLYERHEVEKTLELLKSKGHLYEQDGALWFRSTAFGDDKDRVVRKSSGEATYLAPDIAYHRYKFERGFSWLINLLGPDHHGYVMRLKAACQALGHKSNDIEVRIVQLTTLYRNGEPVRMSTRAGEFVTLRELVQEVGPDATRFFFIMRKIESHLDFDLELAKQKSQDNPVYYLQYAHARIAGLIKFANRSLKVDANFALLASEEETALILQVSQFSKALVAASQLLEPYRLADYLREVAVCFHKFYSRHRVVTDDEALTDARLMLVEATRIVLRNGLRILGISQPESM